MALSRHKDSGLSDRLALRAGRRVARGLVDSINEPLTKRSWPVSSSHLLESREGQDVCERTTLQTYYRRDDKRSPGLSREGDVPRGCGRARRRIIDPIDCSRLHFARRRQTHRRKRFGGMTRRSRYRFWHRRWLTLGSGSRAGRNERPLFRGVIAAAANYLNFSSSN